MPTFANMNPGYWLLLILLLPILLFSVKLNKLTTAGASTGAVIGCFVFLGAGYSGIMMLGIFFLLGIMATSWKMDTKEKMGAAERNNGKRTAGQVIANGGMAGIAGLLSASFPQHQSLFQLMMAAAIASAMADTLSSELGTVYGKNFYNVINFQEDKRGENGVVSVEGTLIGIFGSGIIALLYAVGFGCDLRFAWIILAGTIGNLTDSILGATLERNNYLKNDAVNFINTLAAALVALLLTKLF